MSQVHNQALRDALRHAGVFDQKPGKGRSIGPRAHPVIWTDAEWLTLARTLSRMFPELGLPNPNHLVRVNMRHLMHAQTVFPAQRRRDLKSVACVRPRLAEVLRVLSADPSATEVPTPAPAPAPAAAQVTPSALVEQVVFRQPDGPDNGKAGAKIFWREPEWDAIAVELAYHNPALLENLSTLRPVDVFHAQRVLPTNRRRQQTVFLNATIRADLGPAFRRLRAKIEAARREQLEAVAQAAAARADQAAKAQQAAQDAAQDAIKAALLQSPDFIAQALSAAPIASLFQALTVQLVTQAQGMIESAVINALSSERVKQALTVNVHVESPAAPGNAPAPAPTVAANVAASVVTKPRIGIVGALAQQGHELEKAFPQLRIKVVDKNLHGQSLREAVHGCDKVIAMTGFINHGVDGVCSKVLGDRYTRVDGGVSAVRRQIDVWIASGVIKTTTQAAAPQSASASVG